MGDFVGAIDQGTTSTRFIVFDHEGREVARHQIEHSQMFPKPGWVEHDPVEILERARATLHGALETARLSIADLSCIGVANQRETTVVWNPKNGVPYANAVVWQDTRTDQIVRAIEEAGQGELVRERCGIPPATYFAGGKLSWLLDHVDDLRRLAERQDAVFGTIDSWLVWNLTGGPNGGRHVTDVTNASRTMLMDLDRLEWDDDLLALFGVPKAMLPRICPSASRSAFGAIEIDGGNGHVPIAAVLGDQQAAMIGQLCFSPGDAKNTYGTGSFLLSNTGDSIVRSKYGLLTTVCYQFEGSPPIFALEGSVAAAGSVIQWLRDQLGLIETAEESEVLARTVEDTAGVYFVPAFSGLFAPYWRTDARGVIVGLTRSAGRAHFARAALEAICHQSADIVDAIQQDTRVPLAVLKVDGGVTANTLCMQLQADILGVPVSKPAIAETTALGAAYAAGLAIGFWSGVDDLRSHWREAARFEPTWSGQRRQTSRNRWSQAVAHTFDWEPT